MYQSGRNGRKANSRERERKTERLEKHAVKEDERDRLEIEFYFEVIAGIGALFLNKYKILAFKSTS